MFSVGDKITYGTMGVCMVEDICSVEIPGAARKCYLLVPKYVPNSKIYAPIENNPVECRHLLTKGETEALIDSLPEIEAFPPEKEKQELYEIFRGAVKSTDTVQLARLLKTLYARRTRQQADKKTIPFAEKEFFDKAEMILYGEIATVIGIELKEVETFITDRLESEFIYS